MAYLDKRSLDAKLTEHRFWNTDEIKIESASTGIFDDFWNGIKSLQKTPGHDLERCLHSQINDNNHDNIAGLVRLAVFCSTETPNRFKAIFPAFLVKNNLARFNNDTFEWEGSKSTKTPQITIEKLVKVLSGNDKGKLTAASHFCRWAEDCGAHYALLEISKHGEQMPSFVNALAVRLAQGADTNKRGHGATDKIKVKLREYGFSPELKNTNSSDVAVAELVPSYFGPRKYDTVIYNAMGSLCLISQSQMYSSDVGSVQGKSVEEDSSANQLLKDKWCDCCVLTHTEGFGCHTTMKSRLNHVLNSEVDGFIQLKTLDIKLPAILRQCNCPSLLDLELCLVETTLGKTVNELQSLMSTVYGFERTLVCETINFYHKQKLLEVSDKQLIKVRFDRLPIAIKHFCIQNLLEKSKKSDESETKVWRLGGLATESFISIQEFDSVIANGTKLAKLHGVDFEEVKNLIDQCEAIKWVP